MTENNRNYRITSFQGVPFAGTSFLNENELKTASNNSLYFPTEGGTVLTDRTVGDHTPKELETEYNQLMNYLRHWAKAGNFNMDDLDEYISTDHNAQLTLQEQIAQLEQQIAALTEEQREIQAQLIKNANDTQVEDGADDGELAAERLTLFNRSKEVSEQLAELNAQLETLNAQANH